MCNYLVTSKALHRYHRFSNTATDHTLLLIVFIVGFYGEKLDPNSKKVFVIKDHAFGNALKYDTAIVVIRNPYNALRAEFNRQNTGSHINRVDDKILLTEGNISFIIFSTQLWFGYCTTVFAL